MSPVTTLSNFDHSSIDIRNVNARRAHMKAFFLHLGLWIEENVKEIRNYSQEQASEILYSTGQRQVNQVYFELMVDQIFWFNVVNNGNLFGQDPDWPWTYEGVIDKTDVATSGPSVFYKEWQRRSLPGKIEHIMATGQVLDFDKLSFHVDYMPKDTHIECIFGGGSTRFPAHRIRALDEKQLRSYILGVVDGAFPLCAKAYAADEILPLTRYKIIRGDSGN
ncbi:hypothetical protein FPRO04_07501 [Fusarium proliferatum]|nr:hypothetical protein FPRO03_13132 [Fusarium proliferatum]KAG4277204.1 hypothetical protein FPRO04_07501 [Fusarium proliferatum]